MSERERLIALAKAEGFWDGSATTETGKPIYYATANDIEAFAAALSQPHASEQEAAPALTSSGLERLARLGCGGDNTRWTFSDEGLRRTIEAAVKSAELHEAHPAVTLPQLSCRHSNRSDCGLYGFNDAEPATKRPSREWYAAKIAETLDDDFVIGAIPPAAPHAPAPVQADQARLDIARAIEACEEVEEPRYHGYENPNTFNDGKWACIAAIRALATPAQAAPTEPLITVESSLRFRLDGAQQKIAHLEEENRELRGRLPSKDLSFMFDEPATVAADTLTDELPGMWEQSDIAGGETDCQPVAAGSDARRAFEVWAKPILGDNPTWRESGDCELAWQAWQAASPARAAEPVAAPAPVPVEQAMDEAVATGDGTLHGAIDYWQERALKAEAAVGEQETETQGGHLTITTNREGQCVLVSWQDDEHRILRVVWEADGPYTPHKTEQEKATEGATWREHAATWLQSQAEAQRQINAQYPDHFKAYPSWEAKVRTLESLARDVMTGAAAPSSQAAKGDGS